MPLYVLFLTSYFRCCLHPGVEIETCQCCFEYELRFCPLRPLPFCGSDSVLSHSDPSSQLIIHPSKRLHVVYHSTLSSLLFKQPHTLPFMNMFDTIPNISISKSFRRHVQLLLKANNNNLNN